MQWITLFVFYTAQCISGSLIYENVIFQRVAEISATRASWTVTFVEDLSTFDDLCHRVKRDILDLSNALSEIVPKLDHNSQFQLRSSFRKLLPTFENYRNEFERTMKGYREFHLLHARNKRSVLPFVGDLASLLFGTVSESELVSVKRGLNAAAKNQKKIAHVLEESLTISNITRAEVAENRHQLNEIVTAVEGMDMKLKGMNNATATSIYELGNFVEMYTRTQISLDVLKYQVQQISSYYEYLQLQLNMLSLGKLSPSVITPIDFQKLLLDLRTKIPNNFRLFQDPETNLWYYYQHLSSNTALLNKKILVILKVPLLDLNDPYEIFQIHNLPYPNLISRPNMVAQFEIEAPGLAINRDRTRYVLLTNKDLERCGKTQQPYCRLNQPVYPTSANRHCVIALFTKNNALTTKTCKPIVHPNAILPFPLYLTNRNWAIATRKPLNLHISCAQMNPYVLKINPPITVISMNLSCSATCGDFILPPFYERSSVYELSDPFEPLFNNYNFTETSIWKPFNKINPYKMTRLPEQLRTLNTIPMTNLISEIESMEDASVDDGFRMPWMSYLPIVIVAIFIIAVIFRYRTEITRKISRIHFFPRTSAARAENSNNERTMELTEIPSTIIGSEEGLSEKHGDEPRRLRTSPFGGNA